MPSLHFVLAASVLSVASFSTSACSHEPGSSAASAPRLTSAVASAPSAQPVYDVPVDGLPVLGKASAPVTLVEFADYECPFCQRGEATMKQLRAKYGDQVRFAFAVHPLPFHPQARPAALAALAADRQGKFAPMHEALLQRAIGDDGKPLTDAEIEAAAREAGLSLDTLAADEQAAQPVLALADALASRLNVRGTPTVFVNGKIIVGAMPLSTYEALIDSELAAAHALVASGVRPEDVYKRTIKNGAATVAEGEGEGDCAEDCARK
jgi:protein-disulfide isomerase